MSLTSKFYRVEKPFAYFIQLGHRWSNTWIGRSQCSEQVLEEAEASVGQLFHDLPGGLFSNADPAAMTDLGYIVVLTRPKHIFEKSYGPHPDRLRLLQLIRDGYLTETTAPAEEPDYRAWREFSDEILE